MYISVYETMVALVCMDDDGGSSLLRRAFRRRRYLDTTLHDYSDMLPIRGGSSRNLAHTAFGTDTAPSNLKYVVVS